MLLHITTKAKTMLLKKNLFICFLSFSTFIFSQQGDGGIPNSKKHFSNFKNIDHKLFEQPNIDQLKSEDQITDNTGSAPWRFGYNNSTNLNILNSGTWFDLPNGDRLWLLKITCQNALTINLTFSNTEIGDHK